MESATEAVSVVKEEGVFTNVYMCIMPGVDCFGVYLILFGRPCGFPNAAPEQNPERTPD